MIWLSALQTGGRRSWLWRRRSRLGPAAAQSFTHGAFNAKEEENFLHLLIRPEKELVLIIVPLADRKSCDAANLRCNCADNWGGGRYFFLCRLMM